MSFILGNKTVLSAFEAVADTGRFSHAYIIEGAVGSGRLTLARAIASILAGKEHAPKITAGVHQDVYELRCEEGSSTIKIDQIREIISQAYIKPAECDKKIFIIENAQQMVPPAQNALLQIFEEPPKNVMFFLLVTNRNLLLSTLKSRAVTLKTEKFPDSFVREELKKRYPDAHSLIEEAVLIADGALGKAFAFLDDEKSRKAVTLVKSYFSAVNEGASFSRLSSVISPSVSNDRNYLFSVMNYFSLALRDILTFSVGYTEKTMFFADRSLLEELSQGLDRQRLFSAYETVCRIMRDVSKINVSLALSSVNMSLAGDFA
ncbi:MAG: hypothetical protein IKL05_03595 [Clostridia bacterium]|nr:hypothetical protein [Clostridia bacterium]